VALILTEFPIGSFTKVFTEGIREAGAAVRKEEYCPICPAAVVKEIENLLSDRLRFETGICCVDDLKNPFRWET